MDYWYRGLWQLHRLLSHSHSLVLNRHLLQEIYLSLMTLCSLLRCSVTWTSTSGLSPQMKTFFSTLCFCQSSKWAEPVPLLLLSPQLKTCLRLKSLRKSAKGKPLTKNTPAAPSAVRTWLKRPPKCHVVTFSTRDASLSGSSNTTSALCAAMSYPLKMLTMRRARGHKSLHHPQELNNEQINTRLSKLFSVNIPVNIILY